jgi:phytoene dehydrogenase-like protein
MDVDAVVVGSGPNGLAAALTMVAAGLRVQVIEGAPTIGGGCRTEELTLPGFWHDVCSAAHPLAVASPFFKRFDLAARGVTLAWPEVEFAHPLDGGRAAVVTRSVADTAAGLGSDGRAYRRLLGPLASHMDDVLEAILAPLRTPPAHPLAAANYGRRAILPASVVARRWDTEEARAIMAGAAAHAMMPLTAVPTAGVGLMLIGLAHAAGWPVVAGGSARITDAMAAALVASGGRIETGRWVRSLAELPQARAILLDVSPRALAQLAGDTLPRRYRAALRRFRYGPGVCKVDFALSGPVPWTSEPCRRAGTLHLGGAFEQVAAAEAEVAAGTHPDRPYVLVVQPGVADPSRAPAGQQTLWTYCHVPSGSEVDMTSRIEAQIERFAPGFRDLVLARSVRTAADEEAHNPNYVGGDIGVGMQTLRQTILRPVPRWNPYRTPVRGLYLCSSATPPVPGVHGRCGELAALTALRDMFGVRDRPDISPARLSTGMVPNGPGRVPSVPPRALPAGALDRCAHDHAGRLAGRGVVGDAVQPPVAARPGRRVRHDVGPGVDRLGVGDAHVRLERAVTRGGGVLLDGGVAGIVAVLGPVVVAGVDDLGGVVLAARHPLAQLRPRRVLVQLQVRPGQAVAGLELSEPQFADRRGRAGAGRGAVGLRRRGARA